MISGRVEKTSHGDTVLGHSHCLTAKKRCSRRYSNPNCLLVVSFSQPDVFNTHTHTISTLDLDSVTYQTKNAKPSWQKVRQLSEANGVPSKCCAAHNSKSPLWSPCQQYVWNIEASYLSNREWIGKGEQMHELHSRRLTKSRLFLYISGNPSKKKACFFTNIFPSLTISKTREYAPLQDSIRCARWKGTPVTSAGELEIKGGCSPGKTDRSLLHGLLTQLTIWLISDMLSYQALRIPIVRTSFTCMWRPS